MQEIWKKIEYAKNYEISNFGRLKSLSKIRYTPTGHPYIKAELILKLQNDKDGYHQYCMFIDTIGKIQTKRIHRLVAEAFHSNPENKAAVNHKDGNKKNNHYSNLEWNTRSENMQHAFVTGLKTASSGSKHHNSRVILDTETGIFYDCIREAAQAKCINKYTLTNKLSEKHGHRNTTSFIYV